MKCDICNQEMRFSKFANQFVCDNFLKKHHTTKNKWDETECQNDKDYQSWLGCPAN